MGSKGDCLSGSRAFCQLEQADLNVTFSWMLLSLIGIWKLHSLSLGREEMQFKLLLMILPLPPPRSPESNVERECLDNLLF